MYKKIILIFVLIFSLFSLCSCKKIDAQDYLRIHIRANSNSKIDQSVKYKVRDSLTNFLTPIICNLSSKNEVLNKLNTLILDMENLCNVVLQDNGYSYKSNIEIKNELFPTRDYGNLILVSDYYDAIIVNLGEALGDNWWCVVYPPLCFVDVEDNVVYKSKIMEIINKFFN